jgi:hypothetical protein
MYVHLYMYMNIASHQNTMYSVPPGRWLDFAAAMDARAQPQHCRRLAGVQARR